MRTRRAEVRRVYQLYMLAFSRYILQLDAPLAISLVASSRRYVEDKSASSQEPGLRTYTEDIQDTIRLMVVQEHHSNSYSTRLG